MDKDTFYVVVIVVIHVVAVERLQLHVVAERGVHLLSRHVERQTDGAPLVGGYRAPHPDVHRSVRRLDVVFGVLIKHDGIVADGQLGGHRLTHLGEVVISIGEGCVEDVHLIYAIGIVLGDVDRDSCHLALVAAEGVGLARVRVGRRGAAEHLQRAVSLQGGVEIVGLAGRGALRAQFGHEDVVIVGGHSDAFRQLQAELEAGHGAAVLHLDGQCLLRAGNRGHRLDVDGVGECVDVRGCFLRSSCRSFLRSVLRNVAAGRTVQDDVGDADEVGHFDVVIVVQVARLEDEHLRRIAEDVIGRGDEVGHLHFLVAVHIAEDEVDDGERRLQVGGCVERGVLVGQVHFLQDDGIVTFLHVLADVERDGCHLAVIAVEGVSLR